MKLGDRILLLSAVINGLLICCCCQSVPEGPTSVSLSPSSLYYTQTEESRMYDIYCSAYCRPDSCTYSWQKSGREVTNSSVLSLGTLYRDEAGNYTCTARNPRSLNTSNSETVVIEVTYGPSIHSMTLTPSNLSYTIIEGHILNQITCYDACAPDCTYYWRKSSTYETVNNTAILSLGSVKRGDAGSYECIARNPRSSTTASSFKVGLSIIYGPDSVTLSTSTLYYYSTKGSVSEIRCFATCYPSSCSFSWRKSGVEFSNTSALSLGSVNRDEAGPYTCTAKNPGSQMSSFSETIIVEVMYGPAVVNLTPTNLSYTLTEGQTLRNISCYADCHPKCTYSWRKSSTLVSSTDVLSLDSVRRGDAGIYECTANNPRFSSSVNSLKVELSIIYGPDSATLTPSSLYYYSTEGTIMSDIRCSASCYPTCTYSWRKSGVELSNLNALSLGSVHRDEAGLFTCTAKNPGSQMSSHSETISVEVIYGPAVVNLTPTNLSYTLTEGQTLRNISCYADCHPKCTYSWGKSYTLVSNTDVLSLDSVRRGDAGIYECTAKSPRFSNSVNSLKVELSIIYGPDSATLTPSSLYYYSTEGSIMSDIRCSASCYPTCTFSWRKSGVELSNLNALSLGSMHRDEAGLYTCTAKNPGSQMSFHSETISVEVIYGPAVVNLTPSNLSYTLTEGQILRNISCYADCHPKCTYSWSKSSTLVSDTDVLSLDSVRRGDAGIFECTAKNPISSSSVNSRLKVELSIIYGPDSVQLSPSSLVYVRNEGESMNEIECNANCNPYPCTYTWAKEGKYIGNTSMLVLRSLQKEKAGGYQCTARNPASTSSETSHTVFVEIREQDSNTQHTTVIVLGCVTGGCVSMVLVGLLVLKRRYRLIRKGNVVKKEVSAEPIAMHISSSNSWNVDESNQHVYSNESAVRNKDINDSSQHVYEQLARGVHGQS